MGELIGDAVRALQAGLEEIMPKMGPWRHGVVFKDGEEVNADINIDAKHAIVPLRKLRDPDNGYECVHVCYRAQ